MLKKFIFSLLAACCALGVEAQSIGEWKVYPSYWIATQNLTVGTKVYGLMNGNLLCYDTEDSHVKTYDCLNDINDVHIAHMAYCKAAKRLVLVYDNGNIDLMDMDDNVWNLASLKESTLSNKDVNAVHVDGTTAYLCTGFGFITLDIKQGVILSTYKLDLNILGILPKDNATYVATKDAIYACDKADNAHIKDSWKKTTEVQRNEVVVSPSEYNVAGGLYWHSDGLNGLNGYKLVNGEYILAEGPIQPNSPVRDLAYRMHYEGERLLVAGGINTPYAIYNPATAMYYEDGKWTNFDETTAKAQYPKLNIYNTTDLVQDPNDPDHHFASPYRTGLYEYKNGKFVRLYNCDNSPLNMIKNYGVNYVSATCLQYDADGNLWMCNQQTDTIVRLIDAKGKWQRLYYSEIAETEQCDGYLFSSSGVNFLTCRRMEGRGFFGFTTNGTLNKWADDKHKLRSVITNQDGATYSPDQFSCMTEDLDGKIWCGTNLGLFVINDASTFFDDNFAFEQIKIARNDGSGLADYLLSGVPITCVTVDGANRKWIGTNSNGVYLISADGQEMIHHFQAEDSPLLSDNIQCIAIHPTTGEVMIGTDIGLCSYMGDATEAEETLDFDNIKVYPNPVSPDYNGPITIDGLTMDGEVKVCSSAGQLIWKGVSNGGRFTWNGCNKHGRRVASGVYNIVANNASGKKAIVTRIIVIR